MRVLIIGCGYVGEAVARALQARGDEVLGATRSAASAERLQRQGIETMVADVTAPDSLQRIPYRFDAVIFAVSSSGAGEEAYRRVYLEGAENLIAWAGSASPPLLVFTSSTTVYAQTDGGWVDETSVTAPPHVAGQIILETERRFLTSALPAVILRLAGIYGPGRHALLDRLRGGAAVLPGDGQHWMNMAHRDDIVAAVLAALDRGAAGHVVNVSDDEPVRQSDYVRWVCQQLHRPMPRFDPGAERSFKGHLRKGFQANRRIANRKLKEVLGVRLRFPNFRSGLGAMLEGDPSPTASSDS